MPIVFKPNEFKIRSPEGTYYQASCIRGAPGVYYGTNEPQDSDMYVWINPNGDVTKTMEDPILTGIPTAPTAAVNTNTTQIATTAFVVAEIANKISSLDAMLFKGTLGTGGTITALPATHEAGWTYKVITAGTYAGKVCEVGDLIICIKDRATADDDDWTVVQTNIDGAVTGPVSSTDNRIALFDGTTGKLIKESSYTAGAAAAKDIDTSFTESSISTNLPTTAAVASNLVFKADKVSSATNGNFAALDSNGNLTDSGHKHGDYLTSHQDISGKADKVASATNGNFASLDSNGNLSDSGHKHSDYLTSHQDISGKTDKVTNAVDGNFAGLDSNGNLVDSGHKHSDYLTSHQDITGKADKVTSAISGNFASLDGNGNLTDSGYSNNSYIPLPSLPSTDGTYVLQIVILDGTPTYSWQAANT